MYRIALVLLFMMSAAHADCTPTAAVLDRAAKMVGSPNQTAIAAKVQEWRDNCIRAEADRPKNSPRSRIESRR